jgi:GR25 family glycosyltransferase involved in LPS biosynthesis
MNKKIIFLSPVLSNPVDAGNASRVSQLINNIKKGEIDYLRLYSRAFPVNNMVVKLSLHRKIYRFKDIAYGAQCYILSQTGAKKLTTVAIDGVTRPVDDEMDRFWHNKLPNYAYYPYPALEQEFMSTIRNELPPMSATGLDFITFKFLQKRDHLLRIIFNLFFNFSDKDLRNKLNSINN